MSSSAFNGTIKFANNGEALEYFSALRMTKVRELPASFAGVNYGDFGELIDVIAIKSGVDEYEVFEKVRS